MLNDKPTETDQSAGWLYKSRMTEYGLFLKNVSDSGIDCLSGLYKFEVLTARVFCRCSADGEQLCLISDGLDRSQNLVMRGWCKLRKYIRSQYPMCFLQLQMHTFLQQNTLRHHYKMPEQLCSPKDISTSSSFPRTNILQIL